MTKRLRYILIPFSIIYKGIIWTRNKLFDKKILRSASFNFPVICVGNLAVGGTGKTPMVEYLVRILRNKYQVATLSRGYKRKTKGFAIANEKTSAVEIGDEPMQIHKKFPGVTVAVAEERVIGIPQLLFEAPETGVIILDDAFQHREVSAGLNILLTDYNKLYTNDLILPAGNLRDVVSSSKRAQLIVVTKCDPDINDEKRNKIIRQLNPLPYQKIYFSKIEYGKPYHLFTKENYTYKSDSHALLICGIANPKPLEKAVSGFFSSYELMLYRDHHIFNSTDLKEIKKKFTEIENDKKIILTTEKDGVRFSKFEKELEHFPVYVLPMAHQFLFDQQLDFEKEVLGFVDSISRDMEQKENQ